MVTDIPVRNYFGSSSSSSDNDRNGPLYAVEISPQETDKLLSLQKNFERDP